MFHVNVGFGSRCEEIPNHLKELGIKENLEYDSGFEEVTWFEVCFLMLMLISSTSSVDRLMWWKYWIIPAQVLKSFSSWYPLLHRHSKDPGLLTHDWLHPPFLTEHSSISEIMKNMEIELRLQCEYFIKTSKFTNDTNHSLWYEMLFCSLFVLKNLILMSSRVSEDQKRKKSKLLSGTLECRSIYFARRKVVAQCSKNNEK